jgi:hypothetical protein
VCRKPSTLDLDEPGLALASLAPMPEKKSDAAAFVTSRIFVECYMSKSAIFRNFFMIMLLARDNPRSDFSSPTNS